MDGSLVNGLDLAVGIVLLISALLAFLRGFGGPYSVEALERPHRTIAALTYYQKRAPCRLARVGTGPCPK